MTDLYIERLRDRATDFGRARTRRRRIKYAALLVLALAVAVPLAVAATGYFDRSTVTTTVTGKERVCDSSSDSTIDCKYLVFTDDTTYRLTDSIFAGRWSSSDAYGRIQVCHYYEIESYGWRLPLFSAYPNIVDMRDLGPADGCLP